MRMLNDVLGINKQGCTQNDNDNNEFNIGYPITGEYTEFDDEVDSNNVLNKGDPTTGEHFIL